MTWSDATRAVDCCRTHCKDQKPNEWRERRVSRLHLNKLISKWIWKAAGLSLTVVVDFISCKQDLFIAAKNCQDAFHGFLILVKHLFHKF